MGKYLMLNKRRIVFLLYLFVFVGITYLILSLWHLHSEPNFPLLFLFILLTCLFLILILTKHFINFYNINDKMIRKGLIFKRTYKWDKVEKVNLNNRTINISLESDERNYVIADKMDLLDDDFEKLKDEIVSRASEERIVYNTGSEYEINPKTNKVRISGWLAYFLLYLLSNIYFYSNFILGELKTNSSFSFLENPFPIIRIVLTIAMIAIIFYVLFLFFTRQIRIIKAIIIMMWGFFVYSLIMESFDLYYNIASIDLKYILLLILKIALDVLRVFIIIEYFKTSDRVGKTFIN